jgi:glycosidase
MTPTTSGIEQSEAQSKNKLIIYQLLPRLFGNKQTSNIPYGTLEENGTGKFNDITERAIAGIKELGITHVWYTGIIAHASLTDYSQYGIPAADADVVKGRAGSPYAIRDYYDVDPDLAVNVENRMAEFEALLERTHKNGLKVIIDFVPNHVAREYHSLAKPAGVEDFGTNDDVNVSFSPSNDYYYIPGKHFVVPEGTREAGSLTQLKDGWFDEFPAKATGNNVFSEAPGKDDWYETIKLNYGVDYLNNNAAHFEPIPPVWHKMRDILIYWTNKGVDGFRCDMAEMVPVEFWYWVIREVKKASPGMVFIAEAYDPGAYRSYLTEANFDYLYDKVGLYDGLKRLMRNEDYASVSSIDHVWQHESAGFGDQMLRFLENHDEQRVASEAFAGDPFLAVPAMVVSATLSGGPLMLYCGQEVAEPGKLKEGYSEDDGRTTIFDYWGVPEHQKWMNDGAFDGGRLSESQLLLRDFYKKILTLAGTSPAFIEGKHYHLPLNHHPLGTKVYAYIRYTENQRLLVFVNFDRTETFDGEVDIPAGILKQKKIAAVSDILSNADVRNPNDHAIHVIAKPVTAQIIAF